MDTTNKRSALKVKASQQLTSAQLPTELPPPPADGQLPLPLKPTPSQKSKQLLVKKRTRFVIGHPNIPPSAIHATLDPTFSFKHTNYQFGLVKRQEFHKYLDSAKFFDKLSTIIARMYKEHSNNNIGGPEDSTFNVKQYLYDQLYMEFGSTPMSTQLNEAKMKNLDLLDKLEFLQKEQEFLKHKLKLKMTRTKRVTMTKQKYEEEESELDGKDMEEGDLTLTTADDEGEAEQAEEEQQENLGSKINKKKGRGKTKSTYNIDKSKSNIDETKPHESNLVMDDVVGKEEVDNVASNAGIEISQGQSLKKIGSQKLRRSKKGTNSARKK